MRIVMLAIGHSRLKKPASDPVSQLPVALASERTPRPRFGSYFVTGSRRLGERTAMVMRIVVSGAESFVPSMSASDRHLSSHRPA